MTTFEPPPSTVTSRPASRAASNDCRELVDRPHLHQPVGRPADAKRRQLRQTARRHERRPGPRSSRTRISDCRSTRPESPNRISNLESQAPSSSFSWMPSKPPFDMMTTRSPSRASAATVETISGTVGDVACALAVAPERRAPARRPRAARRRASDDRKTAARMISSAPDSPNARAKSSWNTRRHDVADRGSKMAQMRRSGYDQRTARSVSRIAVGWCAKSSKTDTPRTSPRSSRRRRTP